MSNGGDITRNEGVHPVAEAFPLMTGGAYREFVADVAANGLREPIWLFRGKIIDGRNRYRACVDANVQPKYREWQGEEKDLISFVVSLNLHRRHLNESQRAMVAAKLANRQKGSTKAKEVQAAAKNHDLQICRSCDPTVAELSEMLNVSETGIHAAKRVRANAAPEVLAAIESGEVSVHAAEKVIHLPREQQKTEMDRQKLMKGKRRKRARTEEAASESDMSDSKHETTIKLSIDTTDPESAATSVAAALDTEFLERFVAELGSLLARAKAARERGMGPARKG